MRPEPERLHAPHLAALDAAERGARRPSGRQLYLASITRQTVRRAV